jgi:uncharacterized Zn-binding protein involved in type VI secretion
LEGRGGKVEGAGGEVGVIGAEIAPMGAKADPGAGATSGCPTLATSSGWTIGGHSAATAGSMFQRRNLVLST